MSEKPAVPEAPASEAPVEAVPAIGRIDLTVRENGSVEVRYIGMRSTEVIGALTVALSALTHPAPLNLNPEAPSEDTHAR